MAKKTSKALRETDLYGPVHDYLAGNGYTVRSEVEHCDITAQKGDDLIVIELKRQFGVDLLYQATERQRISDSVYVAVPAPARMGRNRHWRGMQRVLRQLELGLILVFLDRRGSRVEVVFHPAPYQRQKRAKRRRAVLHEMAQRSGDYNQGGSTGRKLVTAYREQALHIACCLEKFGPLSPKQLRELGTPSKTTSILYSNFYEWFERVGRGLYALSTRGSAALGEYAALAARYRGELEEQQPSTSRE